MIQLRWRRMVFVLFWLAAISLPGALVATAQTATPTAPTPAATVAAPTPTGTAQGAGQTVTSTLSSNATVFASNLNNPRGLAFGPDGNLYVAEAGTGGTQSTQAQCPQVPGAGPYTGSPTGSRISRIDQSGTVTTVVEGFPSSQTNPQLGSLVSGVAAVAFVGPTLYALTSGAGCTHGVVGTTNGVFRVSSSGTFTQTADLSSFLMQNPTAVTETEDFEPEGTWYDMISMGGALYALEPNHGELDRITPDGVVTRIADISDTQGHIVPTALAFHNGNFYVGNLGTFPASANSRILRIDLHGNVHFYAGGLSAVTGVAFGPNGQLYALQASAPVTSTTSQAPVVPNSGSVVRLGSDDAWHPVVTGLAFPTAMTFGPDGMLYISNNGFGMPPGGGQIVRADVTKAP